MNSGEGNGSLYLPQALQLVAPHHLHLFLYHLLLILLDLAPLLLHLLRNSVPLLLHVVPHPRCRPRLHPPLLRYYLVLHRIASCACHLAHALCRHPFLLFCAGRRKDIARQPGEW